MDYIGDFLHGDTVRVPFSTFAGGASVTVTGLAISGIKVYKNFGTTERSSTSGFSLPDTDGIDFDARTGVHGFILDTSDNTDAGFFAAGNDYLVVVTGLTVGGQSLNYSCHFSLENRAASKRANSIKAKTDSLTFSQVGQVDANVQRINDVTILGNGSSEPFHV